MSLAFVPAAFGAALVITRKDRRSLVRLSQAVGIAIAIAGPWWIVERSAIFGYLTAYGYGEPATQYGSGGPIERLWFRVARLAEAIGTNVVLTVIVVSTVAAFLAARRSGRRPAMTENWRSGLALGLAALLGVVALASTTNNGVWFELPLVMVVIPLGALVLSRAPGPLRWIGVAPVIGMAAVQLPVTWWLLSPKTEGVTWLAENHLHSSQQEPGFAEYDPRFSTPNRGQENTAIEEWSRLHEHVSRIVEEIEESATPMSFTLSGNMELFNSNSMYLYAELNGRDTEFRIPDTTRSPSELRRELAPIDPDVDGEPAERVLIVALHDFILFPPDRRVAEFARQARSAGWIVTESVPMPIGGEVQILRHESR